ncbi:MAG: hypothetical protein KDD12_05385 [Lewinella sp.]|nr:hypothetical protein [Lewinella sp.]
MFIGKAHLGISIFCLFAIIGCASINKKNSECTLSPDLKYRVIRKGFVGRNVDTRWELCFEEKRKNYEGLSTKCIKVLLGNPAYETSSVMIYYFGKARTGMITGGITFIIQSGTVVGSECFIV